MGNPELSPVAQPLDPESTLIGLHRSGDFEDSEKMMDVFRHNRQELAEFLGIEYEEVLYTPPAMPHYPHGWKHDRLYVAQGQARHGTVESLNMAQSEVDTQMEWQDPLTGFVPHMVFAAKGRKHDWERVNIFGLDAPTSCYTQPADIARSIREIYQGRLDQEETNPLAKIEALGGLAMSYPGAKLEYHWWDEYMSASEYDKLKIITIPMVTGVDASIAYDGAPINRFLLPSFGKHTPRVIALANSALHYAQMNSYELKLKEHNWDTKWAKKNFAPRSLIINCMDAANRKLMADLAERLGEKDDKEMFTDQAKEVTDSILTRMWFPKDNDGDGVFWPLDKDGEPIRRLTIESLYPLLLHEDLSIEQLQSLAKVAIKHFNPRMPFPTVATTERKYDPANRMKFRYGRGSTWVHHDRMLHDYGLVGIVRRLVKTGEDMQLAKDFSMIAKKVRRTVMHALKTEGAYEYFNPETKKGQHRIQVGDHFAWTATGWIMVPESYYDVPTLLKNL